MTEVVHRPEANLDTRGNNMKEHEMVKELREFFKSPAGQFFEELDIKVMDITNRLRALETPDRSENRCFEPFTNRNVITPCGNTLGWHNRTDVHHPFNESIEDAIDAIESKTP